MLMLSIRIPKGMGMNNFRLCRMLVENLEIAVDFLSFHINEGMIMVKMSTSVLLFVDIYFSIF